MSNSPKERSPVTRSGARRLGDDYQDQVALEVLVDWLEHSQRYQWVQPEPLRAKIAEELGGEHQARSFFASFKFRLNLPSLTDLEDGLQRRFYQRGGSDAGWQNLKQELRRWVYFRHEPPPDGKIRLSDIKRAAQWYQLQSLPQGFEIPPDYVLPSNDFHEKILHRLSTSQCGCSFLSGSPGTGKSTYASKVFEDRA